MSEEKTENIKSEFNEKMKEMGFREIDPSELPKAIRKLKENAGKVRLRDCKSRITITLDADIVEHFKQEANGEDYQTLINSALRDLVDNKESKNGKFEEMLKDKSFLSKLKTELETV